MDLIAGFASGQPRGVRDTIEKIIALSPENITLPPFRQAGAQYARKRRN
jgi:hypothetical protein